MLAATAYRSRPAGLHRRCGDGAAAAAAATCRPRGCTTAARAAAPTAEPVEPTAAAATGPDALPGLPATYKRLVAERVGSTFREVARVEEAPLRSPGPGEVLVRVRYAGVNGGCETFRARGEHAFAPNRTRRGFPLGAEGSGEVAAVGQGVTSLKVGDAVAFNGAAAFAEFATAKAAMCTPVPAATPEAAALCLSAVTACAALEATAGLKRGETCVVTAAAGGTGHFAVQLARLAGARVVAVAGSEAKAARLRDELGADVAICHAAEDVGDALARECPGGVDVIYEGVGGPLRRALLPHLAPGGRLLQVGYISEYPHALPPGATVSGGGGDDVSSRSSGNVSSSGASTSGSASTSSGGGGGGVPLDVLFWEGRRLELEGGRQIIGQVWPSDPRAIRRCKRRVFDLHAAGELKAWVDLSHGLRGVDQVADAVDYMLTGRHMGKVIIPIT